MVDIHEISQLIKASLRPEGRLGVHFMAVRDVVEQGGASFLDYAFDNHLPVRRGDDFCRVYDLLKSDVLKLVDEIGSMTCEKQHPGQLKVKLGDMLDAHDSKVSVLDDETYRHYDAIYNFIAINISITSIIAREYYLSLDRLICAERHRNLADPDTQSFMLWLDSSH